MNNIDKFDYTEIKTKDGKKIFIKIDREACIGVGSCAAIAPLTYGLDDTNIAYLIKNSTYDTLADILAGAQSCPVFAIILLDEHMNQIWPEL